MSRILLILLLVSSLLTSCVNQSAPTTSGTWEILKQDIPSSESPPSVPEATVTKTPATPAEIESTNVDSITPESPTSDVVTPIGSPEKPANNSVGNE